MSYQNEEERIEKSAKTVESIKFFTELKVWQEGHSLVLDIYSATKKFPKQENYGLTSQIRRAAVSVTSNIAEGFKRETHKDKLHFYIMAHGSLSEVQNQLIIARDVFYITDDHFSAMFKKSDFVDRLLTGFIKSTKERIHD